MLGSTVFSASAAVRAGLIGLDADVVLHAGNEIYFAVELWNPEGVDDVFGIQFDVYGLADGNVQLVGGFELLRDVVAGVGGFPPPLMSGEADRRMHVTRQAILVHWKA